MTQPQLPHDVAKEPHDNHSGPGRNGGHRWMMLACCVPMLIIALVLVATGVAGSGFLVAAIVCTVMMALMMGGMGHGEDKRGR